MITHTIVPPILAQCTEALKRIATGVCTCLRKCMTRVLQRIIDAHSVHSLYSDSWRVRATHTQFAQYILRGCVNFDTPCACVHQIVSTLHCRRFQTYKANLVWFKLVAIDKEAVRPDDSRDILAIMPFLKYIKPNNKHNTVLFGEERTISGRLERINASGRKLPLG